MLQAAVFVAGLVAEVVSDVLHAHRQLAGTAQQAFLRSLLERAQASRGESDGPSGSAMCRSRSETVLVWRRAEARRQRSNPSFLGLAAQFGELAALGDNSSCPSAGGADDAGAISSSTAAVPTAAVPLAVLLAVPLVPLPLLSPALLLLSVSAAAAAAVVAGGALAVRARIFRTELRRVLGHFICVGVLWKARYGQFTV